MNPQPSPSQRNNSAINAPTASIFQPPVPQPGAPTYAYPINYKQPGYSTPVSRRSSSSTITPLSQTVMKFPPEVTPGDCQVILARVCIGKTALINPNSVSYYFSLNSLIDISIDI